MTTSTKQSISQLRELGQSLWLDNITRGLLESGTLKRYRDDLAVTGLTSNPTIFLEAIGKSDSYDQAIADAAGKGRAGEELFFGLAIEDLRQAAALFLPAHRATDGLDGWVSLEVSPLLAHDAGGSFAEAIRLSKLAACENLLIKIPGTPEGVVAIENAIHAGVPVNITLLFSTAQYLAVAGAYMRGIERRLQDGLDPQVGSVASIFCQPLGQGDRGQAAGDAGEPPGHRRLQAKLPRISGLARFGALEAPGERRRVAAAAVMGQHRHQGPGIGGQLLHRSAGRSGHRQHHP